MATWTVQPSGGDYTSLNAALSNTSTVASDIIEISGDWTSASDTAESTVEDDNITIRTKAGDQARHAGFYNGTTNWELNTSGNSHSLQIDNTGCILDGLVIVQSGTGNSDEGVRISSGGLTVTILNTIVRANSVTTDQDGIYAGNYVVTVNCENVICIGWGRAGFNAQSYRSTGADTHDWNLISCVAWNCGGGVAEADGGGINSHARSSSAVTTINCHNCFMMDSQGTNADFANFTGTASGTRTWGIDNCISSDSSITARDSGAVNANEGYVIGETDTADAQGDVLVNDITTAPYDLRLIDDAANDAQDEHIAATGAGLTFGDYVGSSVDIAGTTRPVNTSYDIGAFEVEAAGGGTVTFIAGLDGSATLAPDLSITAGLAAAFDGSAALAPDLSLVAGFTAAFDGSADLVANLTPLRTFVAAFDGSADLVADITPLRGFTAAFDGSANLVDDLSLVAGFVAAFDGSADLVADATVLRGFTAGFDGSADLVADISVVTAAVELAIALAGSADLAASLTTIRGLAAGFTATAVLAPNLTNIAGLNAAFTGSATLVPDVTAIRGLVAALLGSGALSADLTIPAGATVELAIALAASAALAGSVTPLRGFAAALDGAATLVPDATAIRGLVATFTAAAVLAPGLSLVGEDIPVPVLRLTGRWRGAVDLTGAGPGAVDLTGRLDT